MRELVGGGSVMRLENQVVDPFSFLNTKQMPRHARKCYVLFLFAYSVGSWQSKYQVVPTKNNILTLSKIYTIDI